MNQTVGFTPVIARSYADILQQPSLANGYELVIEFNDNIPMGGAWYEVKLNYTAVPLPSTILLLGSSILGLVGWRSRRAGKPSASRLPGYSISRLRTSSQAAQSRG